MIDGLKPYPAMKDSGVPWLGKVPEHWDVRTVGALGALFKGNGGNKSDEASTGIPCVRYGDLYTRHEFFITASKACVSNERAGAYTSIRHGDVLFAASGETMEDIGRSAVNLIEGEARCGGDILVLRPQVPVVPRYLGYASDSPASRHQKACMGRGFTVVHIYGGELKRLALPLPPLPEQAAIVRFLDHVDRRIRRYIRAKQKLIKLLEEQKQAIIHRAVTRGLDPNVRLKPSGVEWLGDVPEHWEVRKLRQCGSIYGGLTPSMADRSLWDGDVPWVTPKDMKRFTIAGASMKVSARALETTSLRLIPSGSVLLVVRGMILARRVPVARTVEPVTINQDMKAIIPATGVDAGYLAYRMDAAQTAFGPMIDDAGHGTKRFPTERWKDLSLAMPPVEEQRQIARHLDQATAQVVRALNSAQHEIDLLREYRTRLIADVVTGKLDVREAAARLPEEVEEPEPLDETEADADEAGADDTDEVPAEAEA
jgi:type I restriction enzyme S subunit